MMRIGVLKRLPDRFRQTLNLGLPGPEPLRQGRVVCEGVRVLITWHAKPVHPSNVLAPTQNLTNEAFCCRDTDFVFSPGTLCPKHNLLRVQHLGIECERQERVKHPPALGAHGILKLTKLRQHVFYKSIEILQRLSAI